MEIKVVLNTGGDAAPGLDRDALVADIQAELDKAAEAASSPPAKLKKTPAPEGAQGDFSAFQWILDIAADPAMAKLYARGIIMAINALLMAARSKEPGSKDSTDNTAEKPTVEISVLGKKIALPVATSVIKTILDKLGDE